ncbi:MULTISPECIES: MFS transporter [Glycomyces]|uniref:MFS family permease n=2 Tax=Glycomyces TaxID=58113 RepID=A0A9X3SWE4_9ACTN|nr:MFS transporter [Glycomyces lechevalierae]MDA1385742.1 MFS transporter [Glycomyces lechevalierae]MDR7339862.1 MFS family permease [Glycomyces lechevalierae]
MAVTLEPQVRIGKLAIGALGALALALGTLQAVVEPSLPLLQDDLGIGPAEGSLIFITLLITGAVVAPIAGKLGDRYGGKRVLVVLMTAVSVGGLISGMAPNLPVLLLGQVLQGAMVGALPLSFILVRKHLPPGRTQVAVGLVSGLFTGGGLVGMLIAGPIAQGLSRHWMFAIPTIAIIAATLIVARAMPDDPPAGDASKIDWPGVVLLSATLIALVLGVSAVTGGGLPPLAIGAVTAVVAALATAWVAVERRAPSPMVDLRMLASPAIWSACVVTLLMSLGFGMAVYLVPQLLSVSADGYGFGADSTQIGLFLVPATIAGVVAGTIAGLAARRFGPRAVITAGTVVTATALIALASLHDAAWQLVVARALIGFAVSVSLVALLAATATAVSTKDTGIATSLLVVTRVVGVALGAQIAGAILGAGTDPVTDLPTEPAFTTGFVIAGLTTALALLIVRVMKKGTQS